MWKNLYKFIFKFQALFMFVAYYLKFAASWNNPYISNYKAYYSYSWKKFGSIYLNF